MASQGSGAGGMQMPSGPPYAPTTAGLGGSPTKSLDVPISIVLMVIFMGLAAAHMTVLQINLKRKHKFILSGLLFGFCMARITTCVMRVVWAFRPTNISIAIAAQVFVAAGVVILFVVNLLFAQRILCAWHPTIGWHKGTSLAFTALYSLIVINIIMVITVTVQSFYTLNTNTRRIDRDIQLYGQAYFMFVAFLPIPILLLGLAIPRRHALDRFGTGRFRTKIIVTLIAAALLTLGAAFRFGTSNEPRPRNNPAWYHSKACFYVFDFVLDIIVVAMYALMRVDKRFYIPDGAKGTYGGRKETKPVDAETENIREEESKADEEMEY